MTTYFYVQLIHHFVDSQILRHDYAQEMCTIWASDWQVIDKIKGYVHINKKHNHWIFFRIQFREQILEIWDSLGVDPEDNHFMHEMLHFVYGRTVEADLTNPPWWATWE